jgi:deoxyribose-phosphate aldolase
MRIDRQTLAPKIDHTVLGPTTTAEAVDRAAQEAEEHGMNLCIPPCYVGRIRERYDTLLVVTVIGFPHGQQTSSIKRQEAVAAWDAGADELDVVMNVGRARGGEWDRVREELAELVASVPLPIKLIVEATLLSPAELERAGDIAAEADVAMLKTSTGFAGGGARLADVETLQEFLPVKASGGIGSYAEARELLDAGATRIGASAGVAILDGAPAPE